MPNKSRSNDHKPMGDGCWEHSSQLSVEYDHEGRVISVKDNSQAEKVVLIIVIVIVSAIVGMAIGFDNIVNWFTSAVI